MKSYDEYVQGALQNVRGYIIMQICRLPAQSSSFQIDQWEVEMRQALRATTLKQRYHFIGYSLYCLVASYFFFVSFHETDGSIFGSLLGLSISIVIAILITSKLHFRSNGITRNPGFSGFLILPFIDVFQIAIFQIRFSLEAILFYCLFIKLFISSTENSKNTR